MIWQPYHDAVLQLLPEVCRSDRHLWRTRAPLICFDVVELHLPDRVLRQFGLLQLIPAGVDTNDALHKKDRRAKSNWMSVHSTHLQEWSRREALVVQGAPSEGPSPSLHEYMAWYRRITRRLISRPSGQRPPSHYQPASTDFILVQTYFIIFNYSLFVWIFHVTNDFSSLMLESSTC